MDYGYGHRLGTRTPNAPVVATLETKDEHTDKRRQLRHAAGVLLAQVPPEPELWLAQRDGVAVSVTQVTRRRHALSTVTTWVVKVAVEGHVESYEAKDLPDALSKASTGTEAYVDSACLKW